VLGRARIAAALADQVLDEQYGQGWQVDCDKAAAEDSKTNPDAKPGILCLPRRRCEEGVSAHLFESGYLARVTALCFLLSLKLVRVGNYPKCVLQVW